MAILEGFDLTTLLKFSVLEVEFDSATIVSWAISQGSVWLDFVYLLNKIHALFSSLSIVIRYVFWEATSTADFIDNWVYIDQTRQRFFSSRIFQLVCIVFFVWKLSIARMFNVDFTLLAYFLELFGILLVIPTSIRRCWFMSPSLCFLPYMICIIGKDST